MTTDLAVLAAAIVDECAAQAPLVLFDDIWSERTEGVPNPEPGLSPLPGLSVDFYAPVTGAADLLMSKGAATNSSSGGPHGYTMGFGMQMPAEAFDDPDLEDKIKYTLESWKRTLATAADEVGEEVSAHRESTRQAVTAILETRRRRLQVVHAATAAADILLAPRGPEDAPVSLPLRPKELTLEQVERAAATGAAEHALADEIAQSLIRSISSFGTALERLPATADKLAGEDEETLRDVLLFLLNANWEGQATGETFIGQGKSDILLRWRDRDAFIAECKFWDGQKILTDAVDQLLERYVVWRDTNVALVLFIRDRVDVESILRKSHEALRNHRYALPGNPIGPATADPVVFSMRSATDGRRALKVTFIPVVIPRTVPDSAAAHSVDAPQIP